MDQQQIVAAIGEASSKLEIYGGTMLAAAAQQKPVLIADIALAALVMVVSFSSMFYLIRRAADRYPTELEEIFKAGAAVISTVSFVAMIFRLHDLFQAWLNPDWYAIKVVLGVVVGR